MVDLSSAFVGIKSPTPFWLASAPPIDNEYNVRRAFEAGPPVVDVKGPRYGAIRGRRWAGAGMRRLRPLRRRLSGRGPHHHGAAGEGHGRSAYCDHAGQLRQLGDASEQRRCGERGGIVEPGDHGG